MNLYSLQDIKQIFQGSTVLDIPSLHLEPGGSYALLGPNGSGKTTLLHILALLKAPAQGTLYFNGNQVSWKEKHLTQLRRQVVLVDQQPIMFSTTVQKNVEFGLKMRGVPQTRRRQIALQCLEQVGMQDFAQRHAHLLSGGETQRVAIARALACSPEVMLFDEPTASVDAENQAVIENIIQEVRRQKKMTIIFSTHKRLEAVRLAEHKVFLFEGKLTGPGGENLLPGRIMQKGDRQICIIQEQVEVEAQSEHQGPCRVLLDPEKVCIYTLKQAAEMSSNHLLSGKVLQMTAEGEHIKILLDIGFPVRSIVSRPEAAALGILAGDEVKVDFAPGAAKPAP